MWFYDMEVFKHDWLGVFRHTDGRREVVINDKDRLQEVLDMMEGDFLAGFNNYGYDDTILAAILTDRNPYTISQRLIEKRERQLTWQLRITSPITIDVRQELPLNLSLKEIEANTGRAIFESTVPFDIDRKLTEEEIEEVVEYCDYDVQQVEHLASHPERVDYFKAKLGLIQRFKMPITSIRYTRARMMAIAMNADQNNYDVPMDRLDFDYAPILNVDELPQDIVNFYEGVRHEYLGGADPEELEKLQYQYVLDGVVHKYGFGGIHGAIKNYIAEGLFMHPDLESYYPSQEIKYGFYSRTSKTPKILDEAFQERMYYKRKGDPRQLPLKVGINAVFGAKKDKYNGLFDPKMSNNICINGQLIITQLIQQVTEHSKLIQSNTDGLIIKLEDESVIPKIDDIIDEFVDYCGINISTDYVNLIAQRDVNNYIMRFTNGKIDAKGIFARWDESKLETNIKSNTLSIVDIALKRYYVDKIEIEDTILDLYDRNIMLPFQIVSKMGHTFDYMVQFIDDEPVRLDQNVNRLFASKSQDFGVVSKVKERKVLDRKASREQGRDVYKVDDNGEIVTACSYNKIPNCPDHTVIHNDDISTFDKTQLDLQWYVDLVNKAKFGDMP